MTRRNFQDRVGYGGVPFEQTHPFIAGLIGGGVIVAASIWAMPPLHSGPRCGPYGAQPPAASSCQHHIAIATGDLR